mgnify:CR=1 FL=1
MFILDNDFYSRKRLPLSNFVILRGVYKYKSSKKLLFYFIHRELIPSSVDGTDLKKDTESIPATRLTSSSK